MSKKIRRIRINHSKSPLSRIKKNDSKKDFKEEDLAAKIQSIQSTIEKTQQIIDEFEREEKRDQLLKMIYQEDVDEDFVKTSMNLSENELNSLIQDLISSGFLEFVSDNEVGLTRDGVLYMKNQELNF